MHSRPKREKNKADEQSRFDRITANGGEPQFPEVGEAQYLVGIWADIGFFCQTGAGPGRLTASEVLAWQQGTGRTLAPWEFSAVRDMSTAYLIGNADGEKPDSVPPFGATEQEYDREVVSKKLSSVFGALARKSQ